MLQLLTKYDYKKFAYSFCVKPTTPIIKPITVIIEPSTGNALIIKNGTPMLYAACAIPSTSPIPNNITNIPSCITLVDLIPIKNLFLISSIIAIKSNTLEHRNIAL